jgi:hypothetical protein
MKHRFEFRDLRLSMIFILAAAGAGCSLDDSAAPKHDVLIGDAAVESRSDLTQMAVEVRLEVAAYFGISPSHVTSCFYHSQTTMGYRYGYFLNNSQTGGSYYLTGLLGETLVGSIIEDDVEGF